MMASESCGTSSSSSGDDFVPTFFLLRKEMKSLRSSYDKKRSTTRLDAAAAEAQSGENESNGPYSPKGKKWRPRAPGGIMPR